MIALLEWSLSVKIILALLVFAIVIKLYITAPWAVCKDPKRLDGKTVIITGANTGIGKETALDMARRGARVILACRNLQKASVARDDIVRESGNSNVVIRQLDLASLQSVRKFANDILESEKQLDVLINNAGCFVLEKKFTEDGLEYQMQSNHFGHFLLTNLLSGLVLATESSRIVNVSSLAHFFVKDFDLSNLNFTKEKTGEQIFEIYSASKLCNILFTRELAKRINNTGKKTTVNAVHPGVIGSEFIRIPIFKDLANIIAGPFMKSSKHGAQTSIHVAVAEELAGVTGQYFSDCKMASIAKIGLNDALATELWERSINLVHLKPEDKQFS